MNSRRSNSLIIVLAIYVLSGGVMSCKSKGETYDDKCPIGVSELRQLLGQKLMSFNNVEFEEEGYVISNEYTESEDIAWPSTTISNKNGEPIFSLETNWIDTTTISRINIYSPSICFKASESLSPKVGSTFSEIKKFVDTNDLNSSPDGYLFLHLRQFGVVVQMNIEENDSLGNGISSINDIPDNLVIEMISIME